MSERGEMEVVVRIICVCVYVGMGTYIHADIRTYTHMHTYMHTHTYIHIHIRKYVNICRPVPSNIHI